MLETLADFAPNPPTDVSPVTLSPHAEDELALVALAKGGDVDAFERIYHRHAGYVFALCVRMTADRTRARELTQDVFVQAWQQLGKFRGDAALASWLHRIAVNVVLMSVRSDRRRQARVALIEDLQPQSHDGEATRQSREDEIGSEGVAPRDVGQAIDLERAIAALPPGVRRAFVLHDVEGYRHDEIARMTGSAPGTLRAQLHRARRLLMEALK
jgi:RNA polymerase sigma-70 factor, ECF subfamily